MRSIPATPLTWLGNRVGAAQLVDMEFASGTLRATTAPVDIEWGGNTYLGARQVAIDEIRDQGGELQGLKFTLSGVPSELIAVALAEDYRGRPVTVRMALLDPETQAIGAVIPLWSGSMDQMPVRHGADTSSITMTAESRGISFGRPKPIRYTHADQQRLYPGDMALEYVTQQSQTPDVWPSASFFKQ